METPKASVAPFVYQLVVHSPQDSRKKESATLIRNPPHSMRRDRQEYENKESEESTSPQKGCKRKYEKSTESVQPKSTAAIESYSTMTLACRLLKLVLRLAERSTARRELT